MAAVLSAYQPRQGILLNPSPSASPYSHPVSLPASPNILASYSSLSSSSSSAHPDAENYLFASSSSSGASSSSSPLQRSSPNSSATAASRRIRFAPLPDPRREILITDQGEELPLPPVFINEADHAHLQSQSHIFSVRDNLVAAVQVDTNHHNGAPSALSGRQNASPNPSSLLFSNTPNGIALVEAPSSSSSTVNAAGPTSSKSDANATRTSPLPIPDSDKDSLDRDWDLVNAANSPIPTSALSSSTSSLPPSSSLSPSTANTSPDISPFASPKAERKSWSTKKLLKPLFGRGGSSKEDILAESSEDGGPNYGLGLSLERSDSRGTVKKSKKKDKSSSGKHELALPVFGRTQSNTTITKRPSTAPSPSSSSTNITATATSPTYPPTHHIPTPRPANPNPNSKPRTLFSSPTATSLSLSLFPSRSSTSSRHNAALGRTQSLTSDLRRVQSGGSTKSAKSLNSALNAKQQQQRQQQTQGVRRGQLKMLNGRVYGARRVDPFANVRAEDPEFVEWGYGGMGSVNHTSEGNIWAKVQSSAGMSIGSLDSESWGSSMSSSRSGSVTGSGESMRSLGTGGVGSVGARGRGGEDDDDGSGMAWVKRRKELREKEKKEANAIMEMEAKENGERRLGDLKEEGETEMHLHTPTSTVFHTSTHNPNGVVNSPSTTTSATTTPTIPHAPHGSEYVTTAVNVPAPYHHAHSNSHSHSHPPHLSHNRSISSSTVQTIQAPPQSAAQPQFSPPLTNAYMSSSTSSTTVTPTPTGTVTPAYVAGHALRDGPERKGSSDTVMPRGVGVGEGKAREPEDVDVPVTPGAGSGSGSGEEDEDDEAEGEGSDDDEDDDVEISRPTALGAGVEKISRHKDHTNPSTPAATAGSIDPSGDTDTTGSGQG